MIIQLQGHSDDLRASARRKRSRDGAVDTARHGDEDPGIVRWTAELKIDPHWRVSFLRLYPNFTPLR